MTAEEVFAEGQGELPLTRRELLKGIGVLAGGLSLSAAGYEHLIPFIHQPDDLVPGASVWYATSCRECPAGCGMLVRTREAHAVKCEGNPLHPVAYGRLCARGQAAPDGLYDPDRLEGPKRRDSEGELSSTNWDDVLKNLAPAIRDARGRIALVTDLQAGSLDALMRAWAAALGGRVVVYEPLDYAAAKSAAGGVVPWFNVAESDFILSSSADFLETWVSPVEYARVFGGQREVRGGRRTRFVYVGPRVSATAASADLRIIVPPGTEAAVLYAIAGEAGLPAPAGFSTAEVARRLRVDPDDIRRAGRALRASTNPIAIPGGDASSARAAMAINTARGGGLVDASRPHALSLVSPLSQMDALVDDMEAGRIDVLFVHRANPAYSYPDRRRFVDALKKVKHVVSLSTFYDDTAALANWVLPVDHYLESWGDYQPYPDVANLMQPTMGRMHDTRMAGDILLALSARAGANLGAANYYEYLRRRWGVPLSPGGTPADSAPTWEAAVAQGGKWTAPAPEGVPPMVGSTTSVPSVAPAAIAPGPPPFAVTRSAVPPAPAPSAGDILPGRENEIRLWAFPHIFFYDGRGANKRLLQEIPEPVVRTAWSSWVEMHPDTARRFGVETKDVVTVRSGDREYEAPVVVWRGVAPGTVAAPIGQGHLEYGRFAKENGSNLWPLVGAEGLIVTVEKGGDSQVLTRARGSQDQHGRGIVRTTYLGKSEPRENVTYPLPEGYKDEDFTPGHSHDRHRWAMIVDLDKCIGCEACVAACYIENNVAIVGARGVRWGREMAWLRIDSYIDWSEKAAPVLFDPMLCQHCDAAPCEPVCPVFAAAHSDEGVNMQVYNRCIGTRYCANNCPYKVRRFNWYGYKWPEPLNWRLNPDVTVRDRGVMEKCTFCIQRIREAEIEARKQGREPREGEVTTACQQTCPTGVFIFGDLMDPKSRVSEIMRTDPRAYQALHSLNTKPAVIYLKRIVEEI
jgi:molybdopterin-containing oxidoreductase family iron-sulfur binding subunit